VLFILLIIALKKRKKSFLRLSYFLNLLLIVLLFIDFIWLAGRIIFKKSNAFTLPAEFTISNTGHQPDIYFIVADEYAGNKELRDLFQFDDSVFIKQLKENNFHTIPESYSNYNYTPFSIASLLNMEYLNLGGRNRNSTDLAYCYQMIRDNKLLQFFKASGYKFYNFSVFDFDGQPAQAKETFLPVKTKLITAQTFLNRFDKEIRFNFVYRFKSKKNQKIITYFNKSNNETIYSLTWKLAQQNTSAPKFVYTHLMMPHYPYYFDKNGKEQPYEKLLEGNQSNKEAYIEYLQYSNKKLFDLIRHILQTAPSPPIIVLAGDHGFRHFTDPVETKYYFLNMVSVHLPSKKYAGFSDSLSGVNLFRVILNTEYEQHLPFLKDSMIYLKD
ncbi:MAG: sulfatase-like hydrolase/transferase, partial [Chitinophagaceae bacterium]